MCKQYQLVSKIWCANRIYLSVMFLLFIILYYMYHTHSFRVHHLPVYVLDVKDIACHKIPENTLQMVNENFLPQKKTIYFLETSCKGGLNSRQACAVESAARMHSEWVVVVLFTGPLSGEFKNGECYLKLTSELNVKFMRVNATNYAKGTPLENIFLKDILKKSSHPVVHSSDILRILTLYKYGGLYLDLDVIVMKSFDTLPNNFVVRQSDTEVASGILAFSTDGIGRNFSEIAVRDLAASYSPNTWSSNGPDLIKRTLNKICSVSDVRNMTDNTCSGFHVLDSKLFFPIFYPSWRRYFEDRQPEDSEAYAHHIWNALGFKTDVPKNSLYARLAQKYCPGVYGLYGDKFGI